MYDPIEDSKLIQDLSSDIIVFQTGLEGVDIKSIKDPVIKNTLLDLQSQINSSDPINSFTSLLNYFQTAIFSGKSISKMCHEINVSRHYVKKYLDLFKIWILDIPLRTRLTDKIVLYLIRIDDALNVLNQRKELIQCIDQKYRTTGVLSNAESGILKDLTTITKESARLISLYFDIAHKLGATRYIADEVNRVEIDNENIELTKELAEINNKQRSLTKREHKQYLDGIQDSFSKIFDDFDLDEIS